MPIRSEGTGILEEADLLMLEQVFAKLSPPTDESDYRIDLARRLVALFQVGVSDPDELLRRMHEER